MQTFLSYLAAGLLSGGIYGILALPLSLVWRSTGIFDIAVGGYVVVAGIVAADVGQRLGWPAGALAGIAAACLLAGVTTLLFLLFQATKQPDEHMAMSLGTFGLAIAITAGAAMALGTESRFLPIVGGAWVLGEVVLAKGYVLSFLVALALLGGMLLILARTTLGLRMRAASLSPGHAELLGVPVRRIQCGTFLIGGAIAGLVGVMAASTIGVAYSGTVQFSIIGLGAAVLFGARGPGSAFLGGLVTGVLQSLSFGYVSPAIANMLPSILILGVFASGIALRGTQMAVRP